MKKRLRVLLGIILLFGSIWGVSYIFHIINPAHSWIKFPTYMTGVLIGIAGLFIIIYEWIETNLK